MVNLLDWCVHIKPCKLADTLNPDQQWEIHIYARKDCRECCSAPEQLSNRPPVNERRLRRPGNMVAQNRPSSSGSGRAAAAFFRDPAGRCSATQNTQNSGKFLSAQRKSGNSMQQRPMSSQSMSSMKQQQRPMSSQSMNSMPQQQRPMSAQVQRPMSAQSVKFDISVQRNPMGAQSVKYNMRVRERPMSAPSVKFGPSILKRPMSAPSVKFDPNVQERPRSAPSVKFDPNMHERPRSAPSVKFDPTMLERPTSAPSVKFDPTMQERPRSASSVKFDGRVEERPRSGQSATFDGRVKERPRSAQSVTFDGRVKERPWSAQSGFDMGATSTSSRRRTTGRQSKYYDPIPKGFEFQRKSMKDMEELLAQEKEVVLDKDIAHKPQSNYSSAGSQAQEPSGPQSSATIIYSLANTYKLPIGDMREIESHFQRVDKRQTGEIDSSQFEELVYNIIDSGLLCAESGIDVHEHVSQYHKSDKDGSGSLDFEEVVRWYVSNLFHHDLMNTKEGIEIRQLTAECDLEYRGLAESMFQTFKSCDTDGSGAIDKEEFTAAICMLLKIKDPTMLSDSRLTKLWDDADRDKSGEISFVEFLPWYWRNFVQFDEDGNQLDALSAFYKNFRRPAI